MGRAGRRRAPGLSEGEGRARPMFGVEDICETLLGLFGREAGDPERLHRRGARSLGTPYHSTQTGEIVLHVHVPACA